MLAAFAPTSACSRPTRASIRSSNAIVVFMVIILLLGSVAAGHLLCQPAPQADRRHHFNARRPAEPTRQFMRSSEPMVQYARPSDNYGPSEHSAHRYGPLADSKSPACAQAPHYPRQAAAASYPAPATGSRSTRAYKRSRPISGSATADAPAAAHYRRTSRSQRTNRNQQQPSLQTTRRPISYWRSRRPSEPVPPPNRRHRVLPHGQPVIRLRTRTGPRAALNQRLGRSAGQRA